MRFELTEEYDAIIIKDNKLGEEYPIEFKRNGMVVEDLCNLLNDLHYENELLKEML